MNLGMRFFENSRQSSVRDDQKADCNASSIGCWTNGRSKRYERRPDPHKIAQEIELVRTE